LPSDLEIEDLQFDQPVEGPPDLERGERRKRVPIVLTLRNGAEKAILYALSGVRSLRYDGDARTLNLDLCEPELDPKLVPNHVFAPPQVAIEPGQSAEVRVSVPLVMMVMRRSRGLGLAVEPVDISGLERVACRVAYAEEPYRPPPEASPAQKMERLRGWGRVADRTFERKIPVDRPA
jgi:hypothetical protein